jgi:hypothetical protein
MVSVEANQLPLARDRTRFVDHAHTVNAQSLKRMQNALQLLEVAPVLG